MITKYFASVKVRFDPFAPSARPARLFLSRLPSGIKIDFKVLPKQTTEKPFVEVTFRDKFVLQGNLDSMNISDLAAHFNSHSRKLQIQDAIKE
jgi:large subunit ribosomal protein L53